MFGCNSGGVIEKTVFGDDRTKKSVEQWEKKIFNAADVICLMQSHKNFYSEPRYLKYSNKFIYVDIPLLNIKEKPPKAIKSDCVNFVFTGMIAPHLADPRYFLEVMKTILKKKEIVFNIYGGITDEIRGDIINDKLYNKNIFFHGRKTQEELIAVREEADVFLSFGNYHECGIPCKIFEYISEMKPVINFYKIEKDAARPYIQKYELGLNINQREAPEFNAEKIINFLDNVKDIVIEKRKIEKDFENNTPMYIIKEILKK